MKTNRKVICLFFYLLVSVCIMPSALYSQVTIGSTVAPHKAALLELKSQTAGSDNVTSEKGGLVLPRVLLVDKKTLEPFIANDADFQANKNKVKDLHAGLMVYNLYASADDSNNDGREANKIFRPGIYVWDGNQWELSGDSKHRLQWFYPPAFNLPLKKVATGVTYDLYKAYENQFNKSNSVSVGDYKGDQWVSSADYKSERVPSPSEQQLYKRTELDYVITWYDNTVIDKVSIDDQGILTYDVLNNDPDPLSFLNLVFVVKQ